MKSALNDKAKRFSCFSGDKFLKFHFTFSRNWILLSLWTSKNFSPYTLGVNFEVLKLLYLCFDCHEVCFK